MAPDSRIARSRIDRLVPVDAGVSLAIDNVMTEAWNPALAKYRSRTPSCATFKFPASGNDQTR